MNEEDKERFREQQRKASVPLHGFRYPLRHTQIKQEHALPLSHVIRNSYKNLSGYISWAQYANRWNFHQVNQFVTEHINAEFPRFHRLFWIGDRIVGMGSLAPMDSPDSIQIALWVANGYHGKGIGTRIAATMQWYAFEVFGYSYLYYQHDATNESSKRLPSKLGFRFSHTFDEDITATSESGFWFSWVKERPDDLPPALFQGRPLEDFTQVIDWD